MDRITEKQLESMVEYLNKLTGNPVTSYIKHSDGHYTQNVGNYHLDYAYGGVKLCQMLEHGVSDISSGYGTKRELWDWIRAYTKGIELGKGN